MLLISGSETEASTAKSAWLMPLLIRTALMREPTSFRSCCSYMTSSPPLRRGLAIGGTSVIIVVGVALETVRALESQMMMRQYKGFLE